MPVHLQQSGMLLARQESRAGAWAKWRPSKSGHAFHPNGGTTGQARGVDAAS